MMGFFSMEMGGGAGGSGVYMWVGLGAREGGD